MESEGKLTKEVCNYLSSLGFSCTYSLREKLPERIKNADLILTVGGDGTFLKTAHHNDNIPILGINAEPEKKEGFFTTCNKYDYKNKLKSFFKGKFRIIKLLRLEAKLNNKKLPLAVNEFYIGYRMPYHMSEYILKIRNKAEFQKSSGLLIGTPAGSHAWIVSAHGKRMSINSKKYQFVSREPYHGRLLKQKMLNGILGNKEKIEVISKMPDGIVVVDSEPREFKFSIGDKLIVRTSKNMLKSICL